MKRNEFISSLTDDIPPANLAPILLSLWWDGKGNWKTAHDIAQNISNTDGSWVHAYLHRKEGDNWNADYWYSQAGKKRPATSLQEEWEKLITHFLDAYSND